MGKVKEIFSDIKEEIKSSAEERATYARVEKAVEETRIAENADYAREKYMQRGYKTRVVFEAVTHMLLVITGGLVGVYITHCIYKYDVFGVSSLCADIGSDRITFLQLIVDVLPIYLSVKLFLMARQPLRLMIWRVKTKIYAPIFIKHLTKEKMDKMSIKNFLCFLNTYMMPTFAYFYVDARGRKHEIVCYLSDEQADELERKCKEIFPKPESNVSDYIALTMNEYRKVQKS